MLTLGFLNLFFQMPLVPAVHCGCVLERKCFPKEQSTTWDPVKPAGKPGNSVRKQKGVGNTLGVGAVTNSTMPHPYRLGSEHEMSRESKESGQRRTSESRGTDHLFLVGPSRHQMKTSWRPVWADTGCKASIEDVHVCLLTWKDIHGII